MSQLVFMRGPGAGAYAWFGVFVPTGTPPAIIDRLYVAISKILKETKVRHTLLAVGGEPVGSTPREFGDVYQHEVAKWGKLIRVSKLQIE